MQLNECSSSDAWSNLLGPAVLLGYQLELFWAFLPLFLHLSCCVFLALLPGHLVLDLCQLLSAWISSLSRRAYLNAPWAFSMTSGSSCVCGSYLSSRSYPVSSPLWPHSGYPSVLVAEPRRAPSCWLPTSVLPPWPPQQQVSHAFPLWVGSEHLLVVVEKGRTQKALFRCESAVWADHVLTSNTKTCMVVCVRLRQTLWATCFGQHLMNEIVGSIRKCKWTVIPISRPAWSSIFKFGFQHSMPFAKKALGYFPSEVVIQRQNCCGKLQPLLTLFSINELPVAEFHSKLVDPRNTLLSLFYNEHGIRKGEWVRSVWDAKVKNRQLDFWTGCAEMYKNTFIWNIGVSTNALNKVDFHLGYPHFNPKRLFRPRLQICKYLPRRLWRVATLVSLPFGFSCVEAGSFVCCWAGRVIEIEVGVCLSRMQIQDPNLFVADSWTLLLFNPQ